MDIIILKVTENKKNYLNLLLLADEQEAMIDRYLESSDMWVAFAENGQPVAECVVMQMGEVSANESGQQYEVKNLAVAPQWQRKGIGRTLLAFLEQAYPQWQTFYVGTGDSPLTVPFYKACGFLESHKIVHFFVDNYDKPIFEGGRQLIDMIYLKKEK